MISVGLLGAIILLPVNVARAGQLGHASWYSLPSNITANGEQMDPNELTAAHRSLPFGTRVLVENLANGRSVVVRINDRGPFIGGRIIDLSKAAATSIGMIDSGTAKVRVTTAGESGGSALAALGEATTKAKAGAAKAAVAKADIASTETAPKLRATASAAAKPAKTRTVAAKNSTRTRRVAKKIGAEVKVAMAGEKKRRWVRDRYAATPDAFRTVAYRPSSTHDSRFTGSSDRHPYAMLGTTPSFLKPSRSRRFG
jgi:rare lipoprotein A